VIEVWIFDILLVLLLIAYSSFGYRNGAAYSIGAVIGLVVGSFIAFLLVPVVGGLITNSTIRVIVVVAIAISLMAGGHAAGTGIANAIDRSVKRRSLKAANRVLGALVNLIAASIVISLLASGLASFGIPPVSRTIASSTVLRVIGAITPDPVEALLAQLRSAVVSDGIPAITEALGGITEAPLLPENVDTGNAALTAAAQSVVRITGTATACTQNQSGSGFVVSDDRVITNAHVVSGITEPVVETPGGQALSASVVYFDPVDDLAVLAVPGLDAAALALGDTAPKGATGVVDGYPWGGPFVTSAAEVLAVNTANVNDIYGTSANPREVYSLATTINEGDSGGPFLSEDGTVVGVVFAKSADTANLGYAMTMAELQPVADKAAGLTRPVSPGECSRG